jgi:hypothetical protein
LSIDIATVLVWHSDPARASALALGLSDCKVVSASSREEASAQLRGLSPDLVVARPADARRWMKELERTAPSAKRVFLYASDNEVDDLIDVATEGHQFLAVDDRISDADLRTRVRQVLFARRSARTDAGPPLSGELGLGAVTYACRCVDISHRGMAVEVLGAAGLEGLVVGTAVRALTIFDGTRCVLGPVTGVVRHIGATSAQGLRLGIEISAVADPGLTPRLAPAPAVRDVARVGALLRRAVRGTGLRIRGPGLGRFWRACPRGTTSLLPGERLDLPAWLGARPGELVEVGFDLAGKSYSGMSAVHALIDDRAQVLVPPAFEVQHRRSHLRLASSELDFKLEWSSALSDKRVARVLQDVHATGASIVQRISEEPLPIGLHLSDATLVAPDGTRFACSAQVRALELDEHDAFRCGLALTDAPAAARDAIATAYVRSVAPAVEDLSQSHFEELWTFIAEAGHHYPDYPAGAGSHRQRLASSHGRLVQGSEGLGKTFAYRDDNALVGYGSCLRTHSRTWFLQHLAVSRVFNRAGQVSFDIFNLGVDYAELLDDVDYVRLIWRTENRWPHRHFGWIHRLLAPEGRSVMRSYGYWRLESTLPPCEPGDVRVADLGDLQHLERVLQWRGEVMRLSSDDLTAEQSNLSRLEARFNAQGLSRSREIFVAGQGATRTFALLDHMTPGLCWPEVTNAFEVIAAPGESAEADAARRALALVCAHRQRDRGQVPLAAAHAADRATLSALGFTDGGEVAEWTFHRSAGRSVRELVGAMSARVSRRSQEGQ